MSRLALMIDLERCIGCKSCEAACKAEHGLGPGEYRNRVVWLGDTDTPALDFLTVTCQHCDRPACLRACPVNPKAIEKHPETGVVRVLEDRCTGCGECIVACPYGAMGYDEIDHHAVKCDLCTDRRADGLRPACATVCPTSAIQFGEREQHIAKAQKENRQIRDHDAFLLEPATIYLDRIPRNGSANGDIAIAERHRPAVVDDPETKHALTPGEVTYPYRQERGDRQPDRTSAGACNICFNTCSTTYHLKDGKLVRVTGNEADPLSKGKVCPKSQLSLQLYNSERRLTRPLKRVGARGEGRFEPISWDQALEEIAERMRALREAHGPEALGIYAGTRTGILDKKGYIKLFAQMWGTPNLSDTEPFCNLNKSLAFKMTQGVAGSGNTFTEGDIGSAALYVYLGDNQAETRPVHFGMVNDWRLRNGARMVVVDPRLTVTASKADQWLAIRPGTDLALTLALTHHILSTEQHDLLFCDNWVLGWETWRDYILEQRYDADWAAPITGIDAATIRALADEIATADGCILFASRGVNQHSNGAQTNRALMYLAAITGNCGRKGGTYFNLSTTPPFDISAPEHRRHKPERPAIRRNAVGWLEAMTNGAPYPLKGLIASNNPAAQWPDQGAVRKAFENLDFMVHIDLFENETSAYADYVLPAATGIEKGEIGRGNEDRRIVWIEKVIEPPGEAKADGWIWTELGKRFGYDDVLEERFKDTALFWDERCINHPQLRGCTHARMMSKPWRWVRFPLETEEAEEQETLYLEGTTAAGSPEGHRFPTPSGKLEFFTPEMDAKFRALGLSALPEFYTDREQLIDLPYLEPTETDDNEGIPSPFFSGNINVSPARIVSRSNDAPSVNLVARGFDTELVTGRPPAPQFHSWMHYSWQAQEMWPDLYVQIHPSKAGPAGIEDGQRVKVETAHGAIEARAWLHAGIRETAVFIPIGWGERQPFNPWRSVNYLTEKNQRDPVSDNSNLKTYLCRVTAV